MENCISRINNYERALGTLVMLFIPIDILRMADLLCGGLNDESGCLFVPRLAMTIHRVLHKMLHILSPLQPMAHIRLTTRVNARELVVARLATKDILCKSM